MADTTVNPCPACGRLTGSDGNGRWDHRTRKRGPWCPAGRTGRYRTFDTTPEET